MTMRKLVPAAIAAGILATAALPTRGAEPAERDLRIEGSLPAEATLSIENLLGSVEVRGGGAEGRFVVEASVEAEADGRPEAIALADRIDLEVRQGESGPVVHVAFPLDDYPSFHVPRSGKTKREAAVDWVASLLKRGGTTVRYAGRDVLVDKGKDAAAVAVHLTVTVPARSRSRVDLAVGSARAVRIPGDVHLEVQSGDVRAEQIYGTLEGRTAAGNVDLGSIKGTRARAETGSGMLRLVDVDVRELELRSSSGDVEAKSVRCEALTAVVEHGETRLDGVDAATLSLSAGQGDVELSTNLDRTRAAEVHSADGDVTLRLGGITPFRLMAALDKGEVRSKLPNAEIDDVPGEPIVVRRGGGGADISLRLARGDVTLLNR